MARLTTAARKALPSSAFGEPKERKYPMPDKEHAALAKGRAAEFASPAAKAKIDAKADRKLGANKNADRSADRTVARVSKPKPVR